MLLCSFADRAKILGLLIHCDLWNEQIIFFELITGAKEIGLNMDVYSFL